MTNNEIEVEARNIAVKLGYGRSNPKWDVTVNSIVALCGRVRDADEAAVVWHYGCGGHDHGHPGSDCLGSAVDSIRAGGRRE